MKIKIHAKPRSSRNRIEKISDKEYKVWLMEKPVGGKANQKLIIMLADFLKISRSRMKIIAGASARIKLVEII